MVLWSMFKRGVPFSSQDQVTKRCQATARSYGTGIADAFRQVGIYAGGVLTGDSPATRRWRN
jgi:hypothetical protein